MDAQIKLSSIRKRIDEIDSQLLPLFFERMEIMEHVALIKHESGMPILDESRERQVIERAVSSAPAGLRGEAEQLMRFMMGTARERQTKILESIEFKK